MTPYRMVAGTALADQLGSTVPALRPYVAFLAEPPRYVHLQSFVHHNFVARLSGTGVRLLEEPSEFNEQFPVSVNIVAAQHITDSMVQQGTSDSLQVQLSSAAASEVTTVLHAIRQALPSLTVSSEIRADLLGDVETAEQQLRKPHPNGEVLRAVLKNLATGLTVGGGTVIGQSLLTQLGVVLRMLPG